jgi:uncharacterized protein YxeA
MKNILVLLFVICSFFVFGQNQSDIENKPVKIIKFDISSLMGDQVTNSSGIQLGLEIELKDNLSFEQDLMYIFKYDRSYKRYFEITCENINGIKSVSELRYYFKKDIDPKFTDIYMAPNLILQYTNAIREENDEYGTPNNYQVNRFVFALHGKIGLQFALYKNLYLDISTGLGVRNISSNAIGKKSNNNNEHEFLYGKLYDNGSEWFISLTGSFRLGFKF